MAAGVAPPNIGKGLDAVRSVSASVVYSSMRQIRIKIEAAIDSMKVRGSCLLLADTYYVPACDSIVHHFSYILAILTQMHVHVHACRSPISTYMCYS